MKIRKLGLLTLAAAAAVSLAACSSGGGGAETGETPSTDQPVEVTIQAQASISAEPMYLGIEQGYFAEEGIDLQVVDMPDIAAATAALETGKLDLAFVPVISALTFVDNGKQLTIVAPADGVNPAAADAPADEQRNFTGAAVYASAGSGISDFDGLAGKRIGVPELKGLPDGTITSVLQEAGVDTSGIEFVTSDFVSSLEALKSDKLDAAFLVNPFTVQADADGLNRIMNPSLEFFPSGFSTSTWAASTKWADANPEVVAAFQRGLAKSAEYANENLDEVKQHAIDRSKLDLTPDQMPQSYFPIEVDPAGLDEVKQKLIDSGFYDEDFDTDRLLAAPPQ